MQPGRARAGPRPQLCLTRPGPCVNQAPTLCTWEFHSKAQILAFFGSQTLSTVQSPCQMGTTSTSPSDQRDGGGGGDTGGQE